jgi:hypothetical protein
VLKCQKEKIDPAFSYLHHSSKDRAVPFIHTRILP